MDTTIRSIKLDGSGRGYKRRSIELKRRIVEQTLVAGTSVARIAREHGINANQVFNWRKLYREGLLGHEGQGPAKLLAVVPIGRTQSTGMLPTVATAKSATGRMWLESPKGCLSIEGRPDAAVLRLVLEQLLG